MEQRFTFDQAASVYNKSRPGYPDALVDDVIAFAGLQQGDRIFEVGCGTGQATESFAKRGYPILAADPGPDMLQGARDRLAGFSNVELVETTFEAWPLERAAFKLMIAAQSWHWVSPEARFSKAAAALAPSGALAVFGHVPVGLPPALLDRFQDIYLRLTGKWGPPPEAWYLPTGPFKGWFDESGLFGEVHHKLYPWRWRHSAASYAAFLETKSDHRLMEPDKREKLIAEVIQAIDSHGGAFEVEYEAHLYMARQRT